KRQYWQLAPDLYRAMNVMDEETANLWFRILGLPARLLRATATSFSPDFLARNPIRDAGDAFMQSQDGFIPGWDSTKGIFHVLKRDDLYWEWKRAGGEHAAIVGLDRKGLQHQLQDLLATKGQYLRAHPIEALRIATEASEAMTRVATYANAKRRGKSK